MTDNQLIQFKHSKYYTHFSDDRIKNDGYNKAISPRQPGDELVAQYYAEKYHTLITIHEGDLLTFAAEINKYISEVRSKEGNCRHAFFVGATSMHCTPIIYLKENGTEAIFFADSKGINLFVTEFIFEMAKINVYAIKESRQADGYSCYTDALVFCRDATAINEKTGEYYIPNLLNHLQKNSSFSSKTGVYEITQLPQKLLKTNQISNFTDQENSTEIIHKKETLVEFRKRYTDRGVSVCKPRDESAEEKDVSSYLRKKGIKYADVIEIQFYINQLKEKLGDLWTTDIGKEFIAEAKQIFLTQPAVHKGRQGLHEFAENFLFKIQNSNNGVPKKPEANSIYKANTQLTIFAPPPPSNIVTSVIKDTTPLIKVESEGESEKTCFDCTIF